MPFDGNPAKFTETKHDVFSLEGLIAWLETQEPAKPYAFYEKPCNGGCLLHQYLMAHGKNPVTKYTEIAWLKFPKKGRDDSELQGIIARPTPWTFGAALDRARKLLAERT